LEEALRRWFKPTFRRNPTSSHEENAPCGPCDSRSLHTSYALQTGYEQQLPAIGTVTARQVEHLRERFALAGDTRDLLAARDSLTQLLGISQLDG
jgi:hypothetical protein